MLKMFMLGVLKTILKTVLKYEKNTITLYGMCRNWVADFIFLLRFCTRKRSETYTLLFEKHCIDLQLGIHGWGDHLKIVTFVTHLFWGAGRVGNKVQQEWVTFSMLYYSSCVNILSFSCIPYCCLVSIYLINIRKNKYYDA